MTIRSLTRLVVISEIADLWASRNTKTALNDREALDVYVHLNNQVTTYLHTLDNFRLKEIYERQVLKGTDSIEVISPTGSNHLMDFAGPPLQKPTRRLNINDILPDKPVCPQARTR